MKAWERTCEVDGAASEKVEMRLTYVGAAAMLLVLIVCMEISVAEFPDVDSLLSLEAELAPSQHAITSCVRSSGGSSPVVNCSCEVGLAQKE